MRRAARSPLEVLQPKRKIRRSRASRWRAGVLVAVHLLIGLHIVHWLRAGRTVTPVEPSEAMAFAKGGVVNAGLLFFLAVILLTAVFGRFFCGWACHLVALQDLCRWLLEKVGIRPRPLRSRWLALVPAVAFFYMFLWPVVYRLWIGDSFRHFEAELTTSEFWATFPGWVIGGLTFLICGFVAVYFLGAKGFCTYACPYGAIFGAAERLSPLRIRVTDACAGCGHCTAVCTSNVKVHEEVRDYRMVVDSGCMKCLDCVSVCPNDALYYGAGPLPLQVRGTVKARARRRTAGGLQRWEEAVLAGAFLAAFFTFRGLYGVVPFLMSLGLAAVLAYGVLTLVHLRRRPNLAFRRISLKRAGRLLPGGKIFVAAAAAVLLFWGHSAWLRGHLALGQRAYRETAGERHRALDLGRPLPAGGGERAERAAAHLAAVERYGLFPTRGNAAQLAWLSFLGADAGSFDDRARTALERGEEPAAMHQLLGRRAWARKDAVAAVDAYQRAIAADPRDPAARTSLGIVLAEGGELERAAEVFVAALRLAETSPLVYNLGLVRALQGDLETARALFERALELDPSDLAARENLAGVLAASGRYEESAEQFRAALVRRPGDLDTRLLLARALAAAGREAEAREQLQEVLRRDPEHRQARQLLAQLDP